MRLFLDQGVPRRTAALLCEEGIDTVHASDAGLSAADDEQILDWCRESDRVAVTLDADFHARLAVGGHTRPSVVRVRQEGLKGPEMASLLRAVLEKHSAVLASGAMLTVRHGRVRTRTLPVARSKGHR